MPEPDNGQNEPAIDQEPNAEVNGISTEEYEAKIASLEATIVQLNDQLITSAALLTEQKAKNYDLVMAVPSDDNNLDGDDNDADDTDSDGETTVDDLFGKDED